MTTTCLSTSPFPSYALFLHSYLSHSCYMLLLCLYHSKMKQSDSPQHHSYPLFLFRWQSITQSSSTSLETMRTVVPASPMPASSSSPTPDEKPTRDDRLAMWVEPESVSLTITSSPDAGYEHRYSKFKSQGVELSRVGSA